MLPLCICVLIHIPDITYIVEGGGGTCLRSLLVPVLLGIWEGKQQGQMCLQTCRGSERALVVQWLLAGILGDFC
jgi:hypothetical protein